MALILLLLACATSPTTRPADVDLQVGGLAVRAEPGARGRITDGVLQVDAPDGMSWFDAREVTIAEEPREVASRWAEAACHPIRWDVPATPIPGVWTSGGTCTIEERRYWVLVSVEQLGGRGWMTTALWRMGHRGYEEAWVAFVGHALSATEGPAGTVWLDERALRERLRALPPDDGTVDQLPLPGGGTFSEKVSRALADVWSARQQRARVPFPPAASAP